MNENITIGVIADLNYTDSPAFSSYYYACLNLFKNVKIVNNINDLKNINVLLCGNDHYFNHLNIWSNDEFINYCNNNNIPFFVHTVEHINSPMFSHNIEIQNKLEKYNLLRQRCWDIDDSIEKNTKIARVLLSKNFLNYKKTDIKKNKIVFIGKVYQNRENLLNILTKHIDVDVISRGSDPLINNYSEFLSKLSEYKYVLSPKSLFVNGIPGRFYESLWVNSIPLQEVYDNTLDYYDKEKNIEKAIFFKSHEELIEKLKYTDDSIVTDLPKMFLEDELIDFFKEFNII